MQFSQVAQQAAAGGGVMRALTIQAADIGLAFGTVGTILGIVATVSMPLLIGMFSSAEEEAEGLSEALDEFAAALKRVDTAATIAQTPIEELRETYGEFAEAVQHASRVVAQAAVAQAMRDFDEVAVGLAGSMSSITNASAEYGRQLEILLTTQRALGERTVMNAAAFDEAEAAVDAARKGVEEAAAAMGMTAGQADALRRSLDMMGTATGPEEIAKAASEALGYLDSMFTTSTNIPPEVAELIAHLRTVQLETAAATVQMEGLHQASQGLGMTTGGPAWGVGLGGQNLLPPGMSEKEKEEEAAKSGGRRGGGGKSEAEKQKEALEKLQEQLQTETETELAEFARREELLKEALENKLLTQEEYQELMERSAKEHADTMTGIDAYRYGDSTAQMGQFMGDMATAFASGNEELMQIAKVFGAGEALINAWRAYGQVMADPSLPWFAKLPAAVSLFGSAVSAVNAIKGVGKGGSGQRSAGGGGAAPAAAPEAGGGGAQRPNVSLTLIGDSGFSRAQIVQIAEALNDSGDEGQNLVQIRGRR